MKYDQNIFTHQYCIVVFFVQHLAYYRGLREVWNDGRTHTEIWAATGTAHLKVATLEWCKVFGMYGEDLHWTKTPVGDIAIEDQQAFRRKILSMTGLTKLRWAECHRQILAFRDKTVAHLDLEDQFDGPTPKLPRHFR